MEHSYYQKEHSSKMEHSYYQKWNSLNRSKWNPHIIKRNTHIIKRNIAIKKELTLRVRQVLGIACLVIKNIFLLTSTCLFSLTQRSPPLPQLDFGL